MRRNPKFLPAGFAGGPIGPEQLRTVVTAQQRSRDKGSRDEVAGHVPALTSTKLMGTEMTHPTPPPPSVEQLTRALSAVGDLIAGIHAGRLRPARCRGAGIPRPAWDYLWRRVAARAHH
jgi:hypothetical protein